MLAPQRVPHAVRLLRERVAGPGAPVFDLAVAGGAVHRIGAAGAVPAFTLHLTNDRAWRALGSPDETRIAEAYMRGTSTSTATCWPPSG